MDIERVAIIGAGPCGLAAAKYMVAEQKFKTITIFEQRDQPGGVWNYTGDEGVNGGSSTPVPNARPGQAAQQVGGTFVSPVYDSLETNIPNSMMQFCDFPFPQGTALFPTHHVVRGYLHQYAEELRPFMQFQSQVLDISLTQKDPKPEWTVTWQDLKSDQHLTAKFDAVLVANGHHNEPRIPSIPGLDEWNRAYPGSVTHSASYRRPAPFTNKKVIIIGHSASGLDLAVQISQVSKLPLLISERTASTSTPLSPEQASKSQFLPEITHFDAQTGLVHFANGHKEQDVDHIIFCTGYHFSTPFLSSSSLHPPIITDGLKPHNLFHHVFYTAEPTLAFFGTPQRIVPFPFSQAQGAWVARVFAGRLSLPPPSEMAQWVIDWNQARGEGGASSNTLVFPLDADYINDLYEISMGATRKDGLENEGRGKTPPFWGERERWTRERIVLIKKASQALGSRRGEITQLEELGFSFDKRDQSQEQGAGRVKL
ncbi:hypothetical protein BJX76DRAFT_337051 [Aspergillus varians]